jgi:anion-transporting  ArsA/GET3 family ATPase
MTLPWPYQRLLFVTGKGGVGKTSVTAAIAHCLAAKGLRVLAIEVGGVASLAVTFGLPEAGYEPVQVTEQITTMRITPQDCLREYGLMKLKLKSVYNLVFENLFVKNLINMTPGMEELLLIGKIGFSVQAVLQKPLKVPYDIVLVDAPPTGQGVGLFTLPKTIINAVAAGPMRREMEAIQEILADPETTGIFIVTNAEELAVDEAVEMDHELGGERADLPVVAAVFNKIIPEENSPADEELISSCAETDGATLKPNVIRELHAAQAVLTIRREQVRQIERFRRKSVLPVLSLPVLPAADLAPGQRAWKELADHFDSQWAITMTSDS